MADGGVSMRVDVEFVTELKRKLREINRADFEEIVWYEDGKPLEITGDLKELWEEWPKIGLNNADFVMFGINKDDDS